MVAKDQELLKKLLATFGVEAEEHTKSISSELIELEKALSPERQMEVIETVFREAHSLKGAARAVNLVKVESICQALENIFSGLKARQVPLSRELFDRLHQMIDTLNRVLSARDPETTAGNEPQLSESYESADVPPRNYIPPDLPMPRAEVGPSTQSVAVPRTPAAERAGLPDTVRVSTRKLDSLLRQAEDLISTRAAGVHRVSQLREVNATLSLWEKECRKASTEVRAVQRLFENGGPANEPSRLWNGQEKGSAWIPNLLAFLGRNETRLQSIKRQLTELTKSLEADHRMLDRRVGELLDDVERISMLPFSSLLEIFPKLARDLCRDCAKEAELVIEGGVIEADRRLLEEIKDPLIHLVRNAIDHGIEDPREREQSKKAPKATITVTISPRGGDKVEIAVSDDGRGIDVHKVRAGAGKLGLASPDEAQNMDDQEALALVFRSGLSTSPMITEVSGRGLGLAIVREKAEKVGGTVSVETHPGMGTTIRLILPLTLATFRGVLVRVDENLFVLPTMNVERVFRISQDQIKTAESRETIAVDGRAVSLVRLHEILGIARRSPAAVAKRKTPAVLLIWAGEQIVFLVDEVLNDQEVLVKSLGKQLRRVRNISGATILGTGKVVPVLNVADLVRSAVAAVPVTLGPETEEQTKAILVAEDSITARTLLKNILESAGYKVRTAVDGAEALGRLGSEDFDLVISDVDMPRMSGFDLTARIRADRKLSDLPVVLVTALESRADRERGIDVGANAYIMKSSFDQSNLLEVVRRLI